MATQTAIVIGLVLYVVLTTGVSFFWMSRVRKPADYLVADRGLPFWVLTGTIVSKNWNEPPYLAQNSFVLND